MTPNRQAIYRQESVVRARRLEGRASYDRVAEVCGLLRVPGTDDAVGAIRGAIEGRSREWFINGTPAR